MPSQRNMNKLDDNRCQSSHGIKTYDKNQKSGGVIKIEPLRRKLTNNA